MKKKLGLSIIIVLFIFVATACNSKKSDFKLQIKESSWSGFTKDSEPEEVTKKYDVVLGKKYSVNSDKFKFEIKKVNDDSIVIETEDPFSDGESGIDLNSKKREFEVCFDKETKLVTPTTDAGDVYYLILVK